MLQQIKDALIARGPESLLVQFALRLHGAREGFRVRFTSEGIEVRQASRIMILAPSDLYLVPIMMECFDQFFGDIESQSREGFQVLNFSKPGLHRYTRHDIALHFPGIPEDDAIAAYTHAYTPKAGDLVFDVGAHAGFTTCVFAHMVGPNGAVVAFEPDPVTAEILARNLAEQRISNVTIAHSAIDAATGAASFNADMSQGAGLVDHSFYSSEKTTISVPTLSFADACGQFGVPAFAKFDIEGAEAAVVRSSVDFLKQNPIRLSFESYHRMRDGGYTWMLLEPLLRSAGYAVESSAEFGQMFTWATPHEVD